MSIPGAGEFRPGQSNKGPLVPRRLGFGPYTGEDHPHFLHGPTMSWGVLDYTTMTVAHFDAQGGHFRSIYGHRYLVVLRVEDVQGVTEITLDGSGRFEAFSEPNSKGDSYRAPDHLPASIKHGEYHSPAEPPEMQDLIVIMDPDIGVWEYDLLSCGTHVWNNTDGLPHEYFAVSGTMTFTGTATNTWGRESAATLTTSP